MVLSARSLAAMQPSVSPRAWASRACSTNILASVAQLWAVGLAVVAQPWEVGLGVPDSSFCRLSAQRSASAKAGAAKQQATSNRVVGFMGSPDGPATAATPLRQADPGCLFLHGSGVEHLHGLLNGCQAIRDPVGILEFLGLVAQLIDLVFLGVGQLALVHGLVQSIELGFALVVLGEGRGREQQGGGNEQSGTLHGGSSRWG